MQSSWLTIWNRRIRESGIRLQEPDCACVHACVLACVRVSQCVSQCVSKRERARKRDFDCEVWTCVSRLASVAPDRHTQAQRHTYRFVTHPWGRSVQCACSPVSHSFTYIKMSLRYGALPEDLLLSVTACVDLHTVLQKAGFCVWRLKCGEANRPWHQCPCYFSWKENFFFFLESQP